MSRWWIPWIGLGALACDDLCDDCTGPRTTATCLDPRAPSPFPLEVGNWWRYQLIDPNAKEDVPPGSKLWTIESSGADGVVQFHVVQGSAEGKRYIRETDGRIEWLRRTKFDKSGRVKEEKAYDPPALRVDLSPLHGCNGDAWRKSHGVEIWSIDKPFDHWEQFESWRVRDVHAAFANDLMGRTFDSFCVERESDVPPPRADGTVRSPDGGSGTFCFAYGVGKVFESTQEEIETLEAYCVGDPETCCASAPVPTEIVGSSRREWCPPLGCFDLERESEHCGACGHACAEGEVCRLGACGAISP